MPPIVDPWQITTEDAAKFRLYFDQIAVDGCVPGLAAASFFMKSGLSKEVCIPLLLVSIFMRLLLREEQFLCTIL